MPEDDEPSDSDGVSVDRGGGHADNRRMSEWNPAWFKYSVEYDPFGDEIRDGPRWTLTYTFRREAHSEVESRVFMGLTEAEYHSLVGEHFEWLGGNPDDIELGPTNRG